ncbi:MAG TPA: hypothetical protein DHV80_06250 [Acidimicrobiaceae bacterium]|nr:hypothetical protein [Acidimicrobiaceae bacterium]
MKALLSISALLILLWLYWGAYAGSATAQAMIKVVSTSRAIGKVPKGKKVSDTSGLLIQMGMSGDTAYRYTVTWE